MMDEQIRESIAPEEKRNLPCGIRPLSHPASDVPQTRHIALSRFPGRLSPEELEHLRTCRCCREAFADYVEAHELLTAPPDLSISVLEQSRRLDVQLIAGSNRASKKLQFLLFGLKVGAAVLCSLSLLIVAPELTGKLANRTATADYRVEAQSPGQWNYYEIVTDLTVRLDRLSQKTMEVINHDKKER